ncbi:MAG: hypothetical protein BGO51_26145 [Rhodospirillales bacterium 69-11]|nr:hypothetical protein [Rhodospirillales bacterium]OJW21054.1 MAG: hypothetical protein BGO51_26145 [Rhodospirillales bacterium 69-11]
MRRGVHLLSLTAACTLSACAIGTDTSYVTSVSSPADAKIISMGISSFMRTQLPAASTTIVLDPTPSEQTSNALTPMLADCLRGQGFAIAMSAAPDKGAHTLRYWVTPMDASGELVRLMIDRHKTASQFFRRNPEGNLETGGPFTVAQIEASR